MQDAIKAAEVQLKVASQQPGYSLQVLQVGQWWGASGAKRPRGSRVYVCVWGLCYRGHVLSRLSNVLLQTFHALGAYVAAHRSLRQKPWMRLFAKQRP